MLKFGSQRAGESQSEAYPVADHLTDGASVLIRLLFCGPRKQGLLKVKLAISGIERCVDLYI